MRTTKRVRSGTLWQLDDASLPKLNAFGLFAFALWDIYRAGAQTRQERILSRLRLLFGDRLPLRRYSSKLPPAIGGNTACAI